MKDTRKTPKVASKPENTNVTPVPAPLPPVTNVVSGTPVESGNCKVNGADKIADKSGNGLNRFVNKKPGAGHYPFVETLTETEFALVATLRLAQKSEESWKDYDEQQAWAFIRSMTHAIEDGYAPDDLGGLCDEGQFPELYAAGVACAAAIKHLSKGWKRGRKREIARRHALQNPD